MLNTHSFDTRILYTALGSLGFLSASFGGGRPMRDFDSLRNKKKRFSRFTHFRLSSDVDHSFPLFESFALSFDRSSVYSVFTLCILSRIIPCLHPFLISFIRSISRIFLSFFILPSFFFLLSFLLSFFFLSFFLSFFFPFVSFPPPSFLPLSICHDYLFLSFFVFLPSCLPSSSYL